ncbi:hypothetical protein HF086_015673 [Spodoptera exigua]|uniref:Helicase ATP-binding domain-containing protein n=1 Tax=Spodoptera exigua TaxID=7107 RepID=A0A922MU46_SPOEX|nr:hypothetical protein HF086_015673 [Spodoptera exigua]
MNSTELTSVQLCPIKTGENKENSNCMFYDNRTALTHSCMPAAFDLEDLVEIGREKEACPYYGARAMAKTSHIVFCPYNYLIDPSIRSSVSTFKTMLAPSAFI